MKSRRSHNVWLPQPETIMMKLTLMSFRLCCCSLTLSRLDFRGFPPTPTKVWPRGTWTRGRCCHLVEIKPRISRWIFEQTLDSPTTKSKQTHTSYLSDVLRQKEQSDSDWAAAADGCRGDRCEIRAQSKHVGSDVSARRREFTLNFGEVKLWFSVVWRRLRENPTEGKFNDTRCFCYDAIEREKPLNFWEVQKPQRSVIWWVTPLIR